MAWKSNMARQSILKEMQETGVRTYTVLASDSSRPFGDIHFGYVQKIDIGRTVVRTKDPATGRDMLQMRYP